MGEADRVWCADCGVDYPLSEFRACPECGHEHVAVDPPTSRADHTVRERDDADSVFAKHAAKGSFLYKVSLLWLCSACGVTTVEIVEWAFGSLVIPYPFMVRAAAFVAGFVFGAFAYLYVINAEYFAWIEYHGLDDDGGES